MSKTPKISILVPIYNVESYLQQCLESLVNQTLTDIEIICINDGSTDDSTKIIQDFQKSDSRIKVIEKKNTGYGDSMNRGLKKASGKYIGIQMTTLNLMPLPNFTTTPLLMTPKLYVPTITLTKAAKIPSYHMSFLLTLGD